MACSSAVRLIRAPGAGTRLTQTRIRIGHDFMRSSSGSNSGRLPTRATRTGNSSSMYITPQLGALDRVLGRQVGHQQVRAERRRRAGGRHPRHPALGVDDPLAVDA